jgi:AcrR family transcriptional regulator
MAVADAGGLAGLTIRSLAAELGVKPMAVYHHVANKDEILDGIVDLVFAAVELPVPGRPWREELRRTAGSARRVLRAHPWALSLLESRTNPGHATLRHHDVVIGTFREAGFSVADTAHGYALLDAYVYGFALQEASLPFDDPAEVPGVAAPLLERIGEGAYPHLAELGAEHVMRPGYDFGDEFDFGLDLVLDGIARLLDEVDEGMDKH